MKKVILGLFMTSLISCSKGGDSNSACEQWETVTTCKVVNGGSSACTGYPDYKTLPTCGDDLKLAREGKTKTVYSGNDRILTRQFIKKVN